MKQIQEEKNQNEANLNAVVKAHEKLQTENKVSPYHKVFVACLVCVIPIPTVPMFIFSSFFTKSKLQGLYSNVVADCEREEELIRKALNKIYEIRVIRHERRIQVKVISSVVDILTILTEIPRAGQAGGQQGDY